MKKELCLLAGLLSVLVLPINSRAVGSPTEPIYTVLPAGAKTPFFIISGGSGNKTEAKGNFYSSKKVDFDLITAGSTNDKAGDIATATVAIISIKSGKVILFGTGSILVGYDLSHTIMPQGAYIWSSVWQDLGTIPAKSCATGCTIFMATSNSLDQLSAK